MGLRYLQKIEFQGNIRIFNKRAYTLPEITNKGEVEVWESDDNGNKIADIVAYEINTNTESKTSTIVFAESEYWDSRKIIVEYKKEGQPLMGFKLSFEPEKDSVKIKWNGETCPEFKNQKLRIDPLSPSIVWALCPSLPASDKIEVTVGYKYRGNTNRFQISEINPKRRRALGSLCKRRQNRRIHDRRKCYSI